MSTEEKTTQRLFFCTGKQITRFLRRTMQPGKSELTELNVRVYPSDKRRETQIKFLPIVGTNRTSFKNIVPPETGREMLPCPFTGRGFARLAPRTGGKPTRLLKSDMSNSALSLHIWCVQALSNNQAFLSAIEAVRNAWG